MSKAKDIDFELIKTMSEEQQQEIYYTLAKRANQRFRDIEKAGQTSGASYKAQKQLIENFGRPTFIQSKKLKGLELKEGMKILETFYKSKTATVKGIKEANKQRTKTLEKSIFQNKEDRKKFKEMLKDKESKKRFYDFLSSQQFKTLSKYADSNQVIEDFIRANDEMIPLDEIMKGYDEFLNSDMTFEQVAERRQSSGELLH